MKTVMITGSDAGLGYETARKIAFDQQYEVILACRSREKAEKAEEKIIAESGNPNVHIEILDTSSLSSVRRCVRGMQKENIHLDALINNAGISAMHKGTSADGFEIVFATNYLGHYLLTMELLGSMKPDARIINVTSDMHNPPGGLKWKGVEYLAHGSDDWHRYSYSKLCNILFTYKLADVLQQTGSSITVNCFNPGYMSDTNFSGRNRKRKWHEFFIKKCMPDRYGKLESSSKALASLILKDTYASENGKYFDRTYGIGTSSDLSFDKNVQNELWNKSQEYTGIHAEDILNNLKINN